MRAALILVAMVAVGPRAWAGADSELVCIQDQGKATLWVGKLGDDPLQVRLSQTLTIVMRVTGTSPLDVQFSEKTRSTPAWHLEALGGPKMGTLDDSKRTTWEQTFRATPLGEPGKQPLPLPALQFTEGNQTPQAVKWAPLQLTIATRIAKVDISEARDLAPIEELPPLPGTPTHWWLWLSLGLAGPAAGVAAWLLLRRRPRTVAEPNARDLALRQLAEMGALPLLTPADVQRWHTRLSDVLRRYLENRCELPATRQTTPEFFDALTAAHPLGADQRALLSKILQRCDEAKFAAAIPGPAQCEETIGWAVALVEQSGA
jgi:hypothetical protein